MTADAPRLARWVRSPRARAALDALPMDVRNGLATYWPALARPAQMEPADGSPAWRTWLILAGRGFGKTRTGAETVRAWATSGRYSRLHLVGPTAADVRDVMVEGESGILSVHPAHERPQYEPSKRRLTWPNGAQASLFSADEPDRLRGPQCDAFWADELAAWRRPEAWDQLRFGHRLGRDPRGIVTTTPRPTAIIRELLADPHTHTTRGSTYDNRANLAPAFLSTILAKYEGTRLGRQEIEAEVLDDVPGALWTWGDIEAARVPSVPPEALPFRRVVVAIDPAATSGDDADETGIVACALGADGRGYVLADGSGRYTPDGWAREAVGLYRRHSADRIVAEVNNGGEMVGQIVRTVDASVPYKAVTASRGKRTRAEPIAALYEQGRVSHVGSLPKLEDQLTTWDAGTSASSPDRLDALVWALSDLMLGPSPADWTAAASASSARFGSPGRPAGHTPPASPLRR